MTPVRVAAIFAPGRQIQPVWFEMDGKKIVITAVNYYWETHLGSAQLQHFSISTDASGLCELVYNTKNQTWTIEQLEP